MSFNGFISSTLYEVTTSPARGAVDLVPSDSTAKKRISGALHLLRRVIEKGRHAMWGLPSRDLSVQSLGEDFAGVPADIGFPTTVGFRVIILGMERELTAGSRAEVYGVGREAIVNALRHSRAKHIETEIEYRSTGLRVAVRDNGCGIDPQGLQWGQNKHRGLQGMRERAEQIGARLRVLTRAALGTEVELSVPARVAFERVAER